MDNITIVQYELDDSDKLRQVLDLHREIFEKYCGNYNSTVNDFADSLQNGSSRAFLAMNRDLVVGFARYGTQYRSQDMKFYENILKTFNARRAKDKMWAVSEIKREFPNNPQITYYDAPRIELIVNQWDFDFQDFGVQESFRRNGLGRRLAEHVLQDAIDRSSCAVYVPTKMFASIIEGSQAHELAISLEFEPLIKISPGYSDGSSLVAMVKQLK